MFRCCVSRIMESYRSVVLRIVLRCRYAVSDVFVGRYRVRVPVLVSRAVSCESYHGIISQCRVADRVAVSLRCQ